jgi:adenine-specific DNA-methyltransferase
MWRLLDIGGRLQVYSFTLPHLDASVIRSIVSRLQTRFPQLRLLLVFTSDWRIISFINVRRVYHQRDKVTVKVHRVTLDRTRPTRSDLYLINKLARTSDDPIEVFQAQCEAFDVERVTKRFYDEYKQLFDRFLYQFDVITTRLGWGEGLD